MAVVDHSQDPDPPPDLTPLQPAEVPPSGEAPPSEQLGKDKFRVDLLSRIAPVDENPGAFKGLIYGPKGAGKTIFCCRAHDCILIAAEPGQRSLLNHPELRQIPVLPIKSFNDMDEIAWAKRDGDLDKYVFDKYGRSPIKTFIIDTMSELSNTTASELLDKAVQRDPNRNRFLVSQAEYKVRNELFRRLTVDYVHLGVNIIMTAHESEMKDEQSGTFILRPSLSDTLNDMLGGLVDLQGRLVREDTEDGSVFKNTLQVHPTRRVDAKSRIGGLTTILEMPDINQIIQANQSVAK